MDWPGFDAPGLYADYEAKWGVKPNYEFVASDDETFQKVNSGYQADVLKGCSQMVPKYREAGLIQPWDAARIPEIKNIDPAFLNSPVIQDKDGIWMIPTDWGVTAVAYNSEKVPAEDVASLQIFTDPKYAGKTALPDAADDVWALAYLATGVTDWTNVTDAQFQAVTAPARERDAPPFANGTKDAEGEAEDEGHFSKAGRGGRVDCGSWETEGTDREG